MESLGFSPSVADPGLYTRREKGGDTTFLLVYVDDVLIAAKELAHVQKVKDMLLKSFDARDLKEAAFFLGMDIGRDRAQRVLTLHQRQYTQAVLDRFGMADAKPRSLPMAAGTVLERSDERTEEDGVVGYSALVGSLLYLSVCTRPDLAYSVGALARHMSKPDAGHMQAAKSVLRYVRGTSGYGLRFGGSDTVLLGFCDADYAGDAQTRRSTSGFVFLMHGGAITWLSQLQRTAAHSTAEAEYMSAAAAIKEALWLRNLMFDLGYGSGAVRIRCDNMAAIKMMRNPEASARTKHIDIVHHLARERVQRREVEVEFCGTEEMVADAMTKPLPIVAFQRCRDGMGLCV